MIDYIQAAPQSGWQCPVCSNVMAPFMPHCSFCAAQQVKVTTITSPPLPPQPIHPYTINVQPGLTGQTSINDLCQTP